MTKVAYQQINHLMASNCRHPWILSISIEQTNPLSSFYSFLPHWDTVILIPHSLSETALSSIFGYWIPFLYLFIEHTYSKYVSNVLTLLVLQLWAVAIANHESHLSKKTFIKFDWSHHYTLLHWHIAARIQLEPNDLTTFQPVALSSSVPVRAKRTMHRHNRISVCFRRFASGYDLVSTGFSYGTLGCFFITILIGVDKVPVVLSFILFLMCGQLLILSSLRKPTMYFRGISN